MWWSLARTGPATTLPDFVDQVPTSAEYCAACAEAYAASIEAATSIEVIGAMSRYRPV